MLIAVIGGKLQGVEAVYLAQKAGWKRESVSTPSVDCKKYLTF